MALLNALLLICGLIIIAICIMIIYDLPLPKKWDNLRWEFDVMKNRLDVVRYVTMAVILFFLTLFVVFL